MAKWLLNPPPLAPPEPDGEQPAPPQFQDVWTLGRPFPSGSIAVPPTAVTAGSVDGQEADTALVFAGEHSREPVSPLATRMGILRAFMATMALWSASWLAAPGLPAQASPLPQLMEITSGS